MSELSLSIIAELGGYNKAKAACEHPFVLFNVQTVREHLLEYRRAHNIFEVGDWVVQTPLSHRGDVQLVNDDLLVQIQYCTSKGVFRHATPAEITAGHRIDESVVEKDAVREAFEKWFIDTYSKFAANGFAERSAINPDNYRNSTVQWQWEAWQARQAEVDELQEDNAKLVKTIDHMIDRNQFLSSVAFTAEEKQKRIDELEREWTECSKQLPPYDKEGARPNYRLLVCLSNRTVTEACYWGDGEFTVNNITMKNVTHWMLLPSPVVEKALGGGNAS